MCLQKGHFSYFIQSWIRTTYASVLKSSGKVPWFMKVPWHVRLFYKSAHHLSGISTLPHFPTPQKQFPCSKHIYYVDIGWLLTKVRLILYNLLSKVSSFEKNKYNNFKYSEPPVEGGSTAGGECYCQRDQLFPPHTFLVNPASTETVMPRAILVLSLGIPSENPQAWFRVTPTRMAVPRYWQKLSIYFVTLSLKVVSQNTSVLVSCRTW